MYPLIKLLGGVRATVFAAGMAASLLTAGGFAGYNYVLKNRLEQQQTDTLSALIKHQEELLTKEKEYQRIINDVRGQYAADKEQAIKERDATIAGLRNESIRLRKRFTCPALPASTGASAGSDGGEESGLLGEDAEFLVRFASEADEVVLQLQACQDTLRAR